MFRKQYALYPNLMGSIFLGDGNAGGAMDLFVGDPPFGVVMLVMFPKPGAGDPPAEAFLRIPTGGRPINLDTVHGSSKPEAIAKAMYRASSRCSVG
jgi:hypothetical protein